MASQFTAFVVVGVGTGINAVHAVQTKADPFPTMLGGVVFGTICVGLNAGTGTKVGTLAAAVFLLSSFLRNGVPLLDTLNAVVTSPKPH